MPSIPMLKCIKKSPVLYVQRNITDARHHVGVMRYLEIQGFRLLKLHAPWGGLGLVDSPAEESRTKSVDFEETSSLVWWVH